MATTQVETASLTQPASVPRKRRRRAPITGAADDCFACRKRESKCDRRRPYCSQCLEVGKDCSGYKTTLTWGVGIASRGKLRGMALPIINNSAAQPPTSAPFTKMKRSLPTSPMEIPASQMKSDCSSQGRSKRPRSTSLMSSSNDNNEPSASSQNTHNMDPPMQTNHQTSWQLPGTQERRLDYNKASGYSNALRPSHGKVLHKIQTSMNNPYHESALSCSAGSMTSGGSRSNYTDSPCDPQINFPLTPDDNPFIDPFLGRYGPLNFGQIRSSSTLPEESTSHLGHSGHEEVYPDVEIRQSDFEFSGYKLQQNNVEVPSSIQGTFPAESPVLVPPGTNDVCVADPNPEHQNLADDVEEMPPNSAVVATPTIPRSRFDLQFFHLPPRLQYLLDYYEKSICPYLVAFDNQTNPYRRHVVQLAMHNPALQNAIAALATNNMRMRGVTEIPLLNGTPSLQRSDSAEGFAASLARPTPEELHYKTKSIEHLNAQLTDPRRASDDSVLATLLILCLFHVCDSGFSKFKTQLAGVQKLLKMRGSGAQSEFVGWVEMFFAWFDVMTSAVNDRETQIQGDSLDLMDLNANLGALEQFSGCDGRLFKLIARLGRLNLLSQSRPVRRTPEMTPRASLRHSPTMGEPLHAKDYYSLQEDSITNSDWPAPATADSSIPTQTLNPPDDRHAFWREWRDIRARLQEWELDPLYSPGTSNAALPAPQRDLLHISESFRHSALLYTERLAHPSLPSSALNFQNLVAQALFHIAEIGVGSCVTKFLLWPLFIAGTECVDEAHRNLIRSRCIEIQKESGFYNNLSGLEVLEKVWREGDGQGCDGEESNMRGGSQAFRWRKAMDRVDGEYIVI